MEIGTFICEILQNSFFYFQYLLKLNKTFQAVDVIKYETKPFSAPPSALSIKQYLPQCRVGFSLPVALNAGVPECIKFPRDTLCRNSQGCLLLVAFSSRYLNYILLYVR